MSEQDVTGQGGTGRGATIKFPHGDGFTLERAHLVGIGGAG